MRREVAGRILLVIACSSVFMLAAITFFIFREGLPLIIKTGPAAFLAGRDWAPSRGLFGIRPMILSSVWITLGALLLGIPTGVACAIYLAELAGTRLLRVLKPAIELLAGIPSVVYGFMGVAILVPLIRNLLGGPGFSLLAGCVILAVMILPTIISISTDSIRAVPPEFREASVSMGATRWQTTFHVILPAARNGILASIILGMGRAIGETMAVIMVAGNALTIPRSPLDPVRPLTSNIALEMGYATGDHQKALFATGIVLFIFILLLNILATVTARLGAGDMKR
ncbi:MAG: Phosphate transport system permease protein PstC [candidate division TA06 bacterium ADurb.Bin417]|uniref:Phosphate transport system permease protein n=1 Tax=candidate division TA06 bacterium ADurb.Bin417 TaxID=1852828 RepID=A0A1V5MJT6_UNCT6|nr:MAG: Phosphate transport system permease protein PstC [candidate division TA06 bacterium ADurb.Bin417]